MISKEKIKEISYLARLYIKEEELDKIGNELSSILDYFNKLKEVDVSNVDPLSHVFYSRNYTRTDTPRVLDKEKINKILSLSNKKEKGFIKINSIFDKWN
jgi:aspartyl-tRNA(Asn)/glutamyl-tRNA(Gln) amidotransferase subunit C